MQTPPAPLLIDESEGMRLCGANAALYLRLLARFPADDSVPRLEDAVARNDAGAAFLFAHTLKGLCAQLALPALYRHAAKTCDLLRAQDEASLPAAKTALGALVSCHQKTLDAIDALVCESAEDP